MDEFDDGRPKESENALKPLNIKEKSKRQVAVALQDSKTGKELPRVTAAGRGKIAEQILQMAFENDIKVREDGALAEMLAAIDLDSPIPTEAFMAVAEILSYVYRANGEPNPFDAVLDDIAHRQEQMENIHTDKQADKDENKDI
jgi:flagellar biosynthesis protein